MPSVRQRLVTLHSIAGVPEASGGLESRAAPEDLDRRVLEARHDRILQQIEDETEKVGSTTVMISVPDRDVSRMQSELARQADEEQALPSDALEAKFGDGIKGGDWWGWLKSTLDWVDREDAHALDRPADATPAAFSDHARVAMASDWGTGLYGAPKIADQMRQQARDRGPFDLLLHLGDVYYSGTKDEIQARMIDVWPKEAGKMTRSLNSNHEMYSGGFGYFDLLLKHVGQASSYFAFQNTDWLLVFLDTAYVDHDMDQKQVGWLNTVIGQAGRRGVVFFSHQQLFSRLDKQGPNLKKALRHLLEAKVISAWYWGHEHQCVLYDRHPTYSLTARCLGNGGIPEPRQKAVTSATTERAAGNVTWKRLSQTDDSPSCLVLDGPNRFIENEENKFSPHGFMTLDFNGAELIERVFLADGTELFSAPVPRRS